MVIGENRLDVQSIVTRHNTHLDRKYLEKWAQLLSDEAEDMAIWNRLTKVLGK